MSISLSPDLRTSIYQNASGQQRQSAHRAISAEFWQRCNWHGTLEE
ncbi:MAG: hypothetical protein HC827_09045 [Cyanobacteria bacterium RM1_2_2]|nr:hypothetical protein [Cyanobacteria bacterium RM1_2_2]